MCITRRISSPASSSAYRLPLWGWRLRTGCSAISRGTAAAGSPRSRERMPAGCPDACSGLDARSQAVRISAKCFADREINRGTPCQKGVPLFCDRFFGTSAIRSIFLLHRFIFFVQQAVQETAPLFPCSVHSAPGTAAKCGTRHCAGQCRIEFVRCLCVRRDSQG